MLKGKKYLSEGLISLKKPNFATPLKNRGYFMSFNINKQLNAEDQEPKAADATEATATTNAA